MEYSRVRELTTNFDLQIVMVSIVKVFSFQFEW